jgi:hypothetical protein
LVHVQPKKEKGPFSDCAETGLSERVSLAAFVMRPQAEHQIGAGAQCEGKSL